MTVLLEKKQQHMATVLLAKVMLEVCAEGVLFSSAETEGTRLKFWKGVV